MYCPKCGALNNDSLATCSNCGQALPKDLIQQPDEDIPDQLVESILVTICCCIPLGIPAIVYASQVKPLIAAGDYIRARESSEKAGNWCIYAAVGGIAAILLNIILR